MKIEYDNLIQMLDAGIYSSEKISLSNQLLSDEQFITLFNMIIKYKTPNIKRINLSGMGLSIQSIETLSIFLEKQSGIISLDIGHNELTAEHMARLSIAIGQNKSLLELNLWHNNLSHQGAEFLSKGLVQNKSINRLNLWDNNLSDAGVCSLEDAFKKCPLEFLNLGSNQITKSGAESLHEALSGKFCRILNLAHNNLGDNGTLKILSLLIDQETQIDRLMLGHNNITDKSILKFMKMDIGNFPNMINLTGNLLTDISAEAIFRYLTNAQLQCYFDLYENKISSLEVLESIFVHNQKLEHASSGKSQLGRSGMQNEILSLLTKKEYECLILVLKGKSATSISKILCKSKRTIENQLASIKDKLNCKNKEDLIEKCIECGIIRVL